MVVRLVLKIYCKRKCISAFALSGLLRNGAYKIDKCGKINLFKKLMFVVGGSYE